MTEDLKHIFRRMKKTMRIPKEEPDHAIGGMVSRSKKRAGKKKAARKKNS